MKIEIDGTEAPAVLRAVSALLQELADANSPEGHGWVEKAQTGDFYAPDPIVTPTTAVDAVTFNHTINPPTSLHTSAALEMNSVPAAIPEAMFNQDELNEAELDSEGQEWNAELHSSSKKKVADGTWRKRRNLDMPVPPPPPPPPPPAASEHTFADFMALTQTLMAEKKLSPPEVMAAAIECGLPSMAALALPENARLIPTMIRLVTK